MRVIFVHAVASFFIGMRTSSKIAFLVQIDENYEFSIIKEMIRESIHFLNDSDKTRFLHDLGDFSMFSMFFT